MTKEEIKIYNKKYRAANTDRLRELRQKNVVTRKIYMTKY